MRNLNTDFGINSVGIFNGLPVVATPVLRVPIFRVRTWKERLFSFTPWLRTKLVGYKQSDTIYSVGGVIYAAPDMIERMKKFPEFINN